MEDDLVHNKEDGTALSTLSLNEVFRRLSSIASVDRSGARAASRITSLLIPSNSVSSKSLRSTPSCVPNGFGLHWRMDSRDFDSSFLSFLSRLRGTYIV